MAKRHIHLTPKYAIEDIYPGIDLLYYGDHRELEYDFVVAPGADANVIRLKLHGASKVWCAANGDLVLRAGAGRGKIPQSGDISVSPGTASTGYG